ncbi:dynamin family protein [Natroniella sp. ANB-PHB2]|uniref:dynamin family protein n=1 Tax=Natroniella sp. ANB-PHB2 TaxID=3384444 RepID=UPI0038D492C4
MSVSLDSVEQGIKLFSKIEDGYNQYARKVLEEQINSRVIILDNTLKNLKRLSGYENASLLKSAINKIQEAKVEIERLTEDLDKPFLLAMIGTGNYGKSTLLNALLGQEVAEMNRLPKTWKVDVYYGSNDEQVQVYYKNNKVKYLSFKEAKKLLQKEEEKRKNSEREIKKKLRELIKKLDSVQEKKEKEKELQDKYLYKSKISRVEWPIEPNQLLKEFRLVDTPGLFQTLLGDVKKGMGDYYSQAEGVIWLLDANSISAKQSRKMLDDLNKSLEEIGGRADNMIAVLNKVDLVRKNGGEEAVARVSKEANELFGDIFDEIVPISAKEALDGIKDNDEVLINKSGIKELHKVIRRYFLTQAQNIQINKKVQDVKLIFNQLIEDLNDYNDRLDKDNQKREKLIIDFERELKSKEKQSLALHC